MSLMLSQNNSALKVNKTLERMYLMWATKIPWYLYQMVTQDMLRTHKGKKAFSEKKQLDL